MKKSEIFFILKSFFIWRVVIFLPILLAPIFFKLQNNFLGGGLANYLANPYFWSWGNFDGEHYLNIAMNGYASGEQSFFPLYPLIIKYVSSLFGFREASLYVFAGLLISSSLFLLALFGIYKLVKLDFSKDVAKLVILLILVFPTSFFFGAMYTESLFLALTVWSYYFFKKENYLLSGILGLFSTATRILGIVLVPVYLLELIRKKRIAAKTAPLSVIPLGLISFMYYSFVTWGDALKFFSASSGFGEQRSSHLILLPQVFYRYFVKIIPNLNFDYFPVIFTTILEVAAAVGVLFIIAASFRKLELGYWVYILLAYLIPTLSGSFSSLPRYIAIIFPAFIYMGLKLSNVKKSFLLGIFIVSFIIAFIAEMLFVRGYFVS